MSREALSNMPRSHRAFGGSTLLHLVSRAVLEGVLDGQARLLEAVAIALRELYSGLREHVPAALPLIKEVGNLIEHSSPAAVEGILTSLAEGLSKWIGDEDDLLPVDEYNDIVRVLTLSSLW